VPKLPTSWLWFAALAAVSACTSEASPAAPPGGPPPVPVRAVPVEVRDVELSDELTGRIEAVDTVEIRPRVSGTVDAVRYREGDVVARGAVLFVIDARPYRAALDRATADLARVRARLDLARTNSARADKLVAGGAIPGVERDSATTAVSELEAELQAATAAVRLARLDLDFTQVRAPIAGRTGQAMVSVGDFVAAGPQPSLLTTVVSVDPVHVGFDTDEDTFLRHRGLAAFRGGKAATGTAAAEIGLVDEDGFPHAGAIDFIDNQVDPATGTIRVRAIVRNPDGRLVPGLYARVRLAGGAAVPAMLIDDRAILTDQDKKYVFVAAAGDVVERRAVLPGRTAGDKRVVTGELKAGDRVVVTMLQKIGPGARVTVQP
jgi:membrane fusion protein, multidrug efflux system